MTENVGQAFRLGPRAAVVKRSNVGGNKAASKDAPPDADHYQLRLFVTGATPRSARAIRNIRAICEQYLPGRFDLEVTDIYQHPERVKADEIIAVPMLVKQWPLPVRRLIGDLSDTQSVLVGLDIADPLVALADTQLPEIAPAKVQHHAPLRTVLYVEDNPANLKLVEQLIARRPDLRLLSASDADLGIQLARTNHLEVILMDINLPGISGIEALKILQEDPSTMHIPVIAISANAMPRDIEKGLKAGFFRYITKPIRIHEFLNTLDLALEFPVQATGQPR